MKTHNGEPAFLKRMREHPEEYYGKAEYCGVAVSKRQLALLRAIHARFEAQGFYPSLRELAADMGGGSTNSIATHVKRLIEKGILRSDSGKSRALVLVKFRPLLVPADDYDDIKSSLSHRLPSI